MEEQYIKMSYNDYYDQIEEILKKDPNTFRVLYRGDIKPIIHLACEIGTISQIDKIIENGGLINDKTYWGNCLHQALRNNQKEVALHLINNGVDIHAEDIQGFTPLIIACTEGYEDIVDILLDRGVEVNVNGGHGRTPLNRALEKCYNSIAKKLIDKGAFVNGDDRTYGPIPLTICVRRNNKEMYDYLLSKGADVDYREYGGKRSSTRELIDKLDNSILK
jgi:hypothetical protein